MCKGYTLTFRAVTDSAVFFILSNKILNKVNMQNYEWEKEHTLEE